MSVELKEISNWAGLEVPDIYFSYEYHTASALLEPEGSHPVLLEWRSAGCTVRLPLLLRPISGNRWDATSCYGYGGPWVEGELDATVLRASLDNWATERGVVCTFLRYHPCLENQHSFADSFEVLEMNETVEWPIASSADLLASMKKKHRQYVRKSAREGLVARTVSNPTHLGGFESLYLDSMARLNASDFYRFPDAYWGELSRRGGCETLVSEVQSEGETVASLLCLVGDELLHAHLLGTNETGRELKANYLAYYTAAVWAQNEGLRGFHLGGGHGPDGGPLLAWKRGFCPSAEPRRFSVSKLVHDKSAYIGLAGTESTEGFFPPWRSV